MEDPEWLATDPEHSLFFLRHAPVRLITFVATRKLRLIYFDGSSAANMESGTVDSQDMLIWGRPRSDRIFKDRKRIRDGCNWGKQYGIDGFVRWVCLILVATFVLNWIIQDGDGLVSTCSHKLIVQSAQFFIQ